MQELETEQLLFPITQPESRISFSRQFSKLIKFYILGTFDISRVAYNIFYMKNLKDQLLLTSSTYIGPAICT